MSAEEDNPLSSLSTLSAQLLGIVAILTQELVRSKAVDVDRLQSSMESFLESEHSVSGLAESDRRMITAVKRVIEASFVQGGSDAQGD